MLRYRKTTTLDSALRYSRRVIARVNKEEDNAEGQKRKGAHGLPRDTCTISDELQQVIYGVGR